MDTPPIDRRRFLQGTTGGLAGVVAGCIGGDDTADDDETNGESGTDDGTDDGTGPGNGGSVDEGVVYAFGPDAISVVDPEDGSIVGEMTAGLSAEGWGDTQITHDLTKVFAVRESPTQLLVIDTATHEIVDEVDIGPGATHVYHPVDDEVWAHADDEGTFYVVDVDSHDVIATVESGLDGEGHGKLLYHESMGGVGYATNVNDPGMPIIDLEAYERSGFVEFDDGDQGTHYKAYSPQNGLVYAEFGDETVVVDPESEDVVDTLDVSGGMYLTPDESMLGVLDGDTVHFIDVTDDAGEEIAAVEVEGGPDALRYHESDDGTYAFTANTMTDRAAVVDLDGFDLVDELDVGYIHRPDGAHHLHRTGVAGNGYFVTPADADDIVAIVDMEERSVEHVDRPGVDTVQIVADSGTGYSGRAR